MDCPPNKNGRSREVAVSGGSTIIIIPKIKLSLNCTSNLTIIY